MAALALTLTGCGGDDDKDSGSSGTAEKVVGRQTGSAPATKSPSPSAGRTKPAHSPSPRPSAPRTKPAASPKPPAPKPSRTASTPRPTAPSGGNSGTAGVQGTWYAVAYGPYVMKVSGTSFTITYGAKTLNGTIDANMRVYASYQGKSATGKAVLGNGGQRLTLDWDDGSASDVFARTKPTG